MTPKARLSSATRGTITLIGMLLCAFVVYIMCITGLVDAILIHPNRPLVEERIRSASSAHPPDISVLLRALKGPDWLMAARAAELIGQLSEKDGLDPVQADSAVESLFQSLESDGHWWRFGWDREEPEFAQFRGTAIDAVARFGAAALPALADAANSGSPLKRESACWVALAILEAYPDLRQAFVERGTFRRIDKLAAYDPDENVRSACSYVRDAVTAQEYLEIAP